MSINPYRGHQTIPLEDTSYRSQLRDIYEPYIEILFTHDFSLGTGGDLPSKFWMFVSLKEKKIRRLLEFLQVL